MFARSGGCKKKMARFHDMAFRKPANLTVATDNVFVSNPDLAAKLKASGV
jgi:hypothetical protein